MRLEIAWYHKQPHMSAAPIPIQDIAPQNLRLKTPKREGELYFSKLSYMHQKLYVSLPHVQVVEHHPHTDGSTTLLIKLNKELARCILELDEWCMEQTKQSAEAWFNNALTDGLIEEYYASTMTVKKNFGKVLKLQIRQPILPDCQFPCTCSLVLHLSGLRFYKKKFNMVWMLESIEPVKPFFEPDSEAEGRLLSDSDEEHDGEEEGPDAATVQQIRDDLADRLSKTAAHRALLEAQLAFLQTAEGVDPSTLPFGELNALAFKMDELGL